MYHFNGRKDWNGKVLDFGGRIGERTSFLKNVIVGEVDNSSINWMIKNNRDCLTVENNYALNPMLHNVQLIYASHVLEHLENPLIHLKQFYKILNENGTLILVLPSEYPTLRPQIKDIDGGGDEHLYYWNMTEIKNLLKESNFKVTSAFFNPVHIRVSLMFGYIRNNYLWKLLWILINTFRWLINLMILYPITKKVKLSTCGEIISYAEKG